MPAGRPKLADSLKKEAGTLRNDRVVVSAFSPAKLPKCPSSLSDAARAEWKRIVKAMAASEVLHAVDLAALSAYCASFANWQKAQSAIDTDGLILDEPVRNRHGELIGLKRVKHPAVAIAKDEKAAMLRIASTFGFNPLARRNVSLNEQEADEFDAFVNS